MPLAIKGLQRNYKGLAGIAKEWQKDQSGQDQHSKRKFVAGIANAPLNSEAGERS